MRLLLIRHAQSTNNLLFSQTGGSEGRSADPPLTELGHGQAQALADAARADGTLRGVTHLYSSLTTRAVQTAAPLAAALELPVRGLAEAYEAGGLFLHDEHGARQPVPGRTHTQLLTESPALLWPPDLEAGAAWAGGFEEVDDEVALTTRAGRVVGALRAAHGAEDTAALVTHGHFTQFLLRGLISHGAAYFRVANTATSLLTLPGPDAPPTQGPLVEWINRFDHLRAEQLSH